MKKLLNFMMSIPLLLAMLFIAPAPKAIAQDAAISFQTFYDNLAPYGQWIEDPRYGNVFVPNEAPGFRPYTRGYWAMTEQGNTWISDDAWGWACYHYGRWTFSGYYGWIWIPGYEWAPAWVSWRYGNGYAGWAPLGPGLYGGDGYSCPENWWTFVNPEYLYHPQWHEHWEGYERNRYFIRRTEYMNNYREERGGMRYNYGPRAEVTERYTHHPVVVYRTTSAQEAGASNVSGGTVRIYRPSVDRNSATSARPNNVMAAPHPIGNAEPAHHGNNAPAPAFRQEHPMPAANPNPQHQPQPPMHNNNPQPQPPMHNNNPQPQPPMHNNNPQPQPPMHNNNPQPQPPMHNNNPQPQPPMHNNNPQPQPPMHNNNPQPQPPMHNNNPQPQPPMHNNNPQPPMHNNPPPQQPRSQPTPQPRPQPAPRPAPVQHNDQKKK